MTVDAAARADIDDLRAAARAFLARRAPIQRVRELRHDPVGYDEELWRSLGELGWIGLAAPELAGGGGGDVAFAAVIAEELGRVVTPVPLLGTTIAATAIIEADPVAAGALLPAAFAGTRRLAVAAGPPAPNHPVPTAVRRDGCWRISGRASTVLDGHGADLLVLGVGAADERLLVVVDPTSSGVSSTPRRTLDGRLVAEFAFEQAPIDGEHVLATGHDAERALAASHRVGAVLVAAEALGVVEAALDRTVEHLRTRKQFDVAIGTFQALQHRAARLHIERELLRSLVEDAAAAVQGATDDAGPRASAAAAFACQTVRTTTSEALQLHGGIGMTDEADIGLYLKRARVLSIILGDVHHHRSSFANAKGF